MGTNCKKVNSLKCWVNFVRQHIKEEFFGVRHTPKIFLFFKKHFNRKAPDNENRQAVTRIATVKICFRYYYNSSESQMIAKIRRRYWHWCEIRDNCSSVKKNQFLRHFRSAQLCGISQIADMSRHPIFGK